MKNLYKYALLLTILLPFAVLAQEENRLQQLIDLAIENNKTLKIAQLTEEQSEAEESAAIDIDKTMIYFNKDQNNLPPVGSALSVWGIQQKFQFPTVYARQKDLQRGVTRMTVQQRELEKIQIRKQVTRQYYTILYYQELNQTYKYLDSVYADFIASVNERKTSAGKSQLEKLTAETKRHEITAQLKQSENAIASAYNALKLVVQAEIPFSMENLRLSIVPEEKVVLESHPGVIYFQEAEKTSALETKVQKSMLMPDIQLEYFQGRNGDPSSQVYNGLQIGVAVPVFYGAQKANIESAQIRQNLVHEEALNYTFSLYNQSTQLHNQLEYYRESLSYYEENIRQMVAETRNIALQSFRNKEIDFFQYLQALDNTKTIELNHLKNVQDFNQTQIEINYISF